MNSEPETLPNNQTLLDAIKSLHQEMNAKFAQIDARFEQIDARFEQVDAKFTQIDNRFEEMRLQMMSFDVRIDRIEALTHEVLTVAYNARADVKVLREEVRAWAKEVVELQNAA